MATTSNYQEEIGMLRRAVGEPVRQLIVVEFDTLGCVQSALDELVALDSKRAHVIQKFDFRTDSTASLLQITREKLKVASGSRPVLIALVGPADIELTEGAPASVRFWREMNLAREAWNAFDAQILLCVEAWSYRQALTHADHLLSWAAMKIHLTGSIARPATADRTALSAGLFGDYRLSPQVARERWQELEQAWRKARDEGQPASGFLQRFFIPMLEAALSLGDLVLARQARETAHDHGQFPDEDMPRWHELNLALALAEHEPGLANEHAYKLLEMAENYPSKRVRDRALTAVNNQAKLLADMAHYALAEPLFRKLLDLAEKRFGPDDPKVAACLNNLAQLLKETNRLDEAEPLMRRTLAADEKRFGPDHPDVAIDLNNLAQLLKVTNRLAEAEPLMRRALAIDEKSSVPDHPKVAIRLNNLASLLQDTNRLGEAEPLMRRALVIDEKSLGPNHPSVAICLNNLAILLETTNRLGEAETLMRRALAIDEKSLGPDHPNVATRLNNLAQLLQATNRLDEAEPLMRRAIIILKKFNEAIGHKHPNWETTLTRLPLLDLIFVYFWG